MGQDDLVSLARRTRSVGCRPPSLASLDEEGAYAKVVVASSKVMEAFNEFAVTMEDRVHTLRNESEVEKGKVEEREIFETEVATLRTKVVELETDRDRDIRRGSRAARREVANNFQEIKDEGLVVEDEIVCLKEMEKDCEAAASLAAASLAAVSDWSAAGLDLPQVS
ncbi:hypothetical protein DY000_02039888 [Brassica cretica]|uniref:Uncharacterized protein n=1 Tax=Brassica cretica TaxID=69181 RepID=A0ABQ7BPY3_BRACR|nr:hypothetical protein DY000_02039888 [Brassica cretica]